MGNENSVEKKGKELKRMRYFDGLLLNADDYKLDQEYQKRLQQLHNRYLHTWGIISGLKIISTDSHIIQITEGLALNQVESERGEKISQLIKCPDTLVDLSEYPGDVFVYIYINYYEKAEDRELEKGQGQETHILESCSILHSTEKPTNENENIILGKVKVVLNINNEKKIFKENIYYYDDEKNEIPLRTYAGPAGKILTLEKIVFQQKESEEIKGMPYIQSKDFGATEGKGIEVNSNLTRFIGSVGISGDLTVDGEIVNENKNNKEDELLVANSFVQVNSKTESKPWSLQDSGLEVYRDKGDALDARIYWAEDKYWKIGPDENGKFWEIPCGDKWDRLVKNDVVDNLHRHSSLWYKNSNNELINTLKTDDSGNLSANANINLNDKTLFFRSPGNSNHGLGWFGNGKLFAGLNVDGPVLYGGNGGVLGTTTGEQKAVVSWNSTGNVGIGVSYPKDDKLEVDGSLRILSSTNPIRFTSKWTAFPDRVTNQAEICNDTTYHKALMIVGNQSAGQGRKVAIWDRLDVNGFLYVNGNMQLTQALTPSAGANGGITFPNDPGGGGGDTAWIRYYPRSGESCTLDIGTSNDGDDNISLMASGNVGVGTLNPADKLDVQGNLRILSNSNPIRFTSTWSGFPDLTTNQAEICNDTNYFKTLMIVGNKSAGLGRRVSIWDRLEVNGLLQVNGNLETQCAIVPSVGNGENNGITFPRDYYGGSGDSAWIRYYSDTRRGGGENMTLEIGISNDPGNGWYYGGGDRIRLSASGGVYIDGYFYYSSSRDYKENISSLPTSTAKEVLDGLSPVSFNFKGDTEKTTLGFIAEEVPHAVAAHDKKAISPMEIIAVLTSVVKDQKKAIAKLQKRLEKANL